MRIHRTATVVVITTALACVGALPAQAGTRVDRDPTGDVVLLDPEEDDLSLAEPAPQRREADVVSLRVTNGPRAVSATMRLDRLTRPRADDLGVHLLVVRTGSGTRGTLDLLVDRATPQGEAVWSARGRAARCRVSASVSYAADTVTFSVPRRCLGNPRWVRAGAGTGFLDGDALYADDAGLPGRIGDDIALGAPVRR